MCVKQFNHVKISGISTVVPQKEINIYDEVQYYENSVKKIDRMRKMVGFHKRRVIDKTTTAADLAYDAALNLIENMKIDKNEIDALIFVVQQPDYRTPSTAYFIHSKLGLSKECIATDINQGCVGWVYGLYMVSQMIESGAHKKVLLLSADTPSADIDITDRNSAPLFGDAGSATLLEYTQEENPTYYNLETLSDGFEALITPFSANRFRIDYTKQEDIDLLIKLSQEKVTLPSGNEMPLLNPYMDGMAVFNFTINEVPKNIKAIMNHTKLETNDIPVLCLHQANKQIVQAVAQSVGFELEKAPYTAFENYGNNTMCSIPTTLAMLEKETSKKNLLCCGFGNGLVCASVILNLENTFIDKIRDFKKPSYVLTRDEYINYWKNKMQGKEE